MLPVKLAGLGWYLPEHIVTSAELEAAWNLSTGWIERTTGVRARRRAVGVTQVQMAARAGQRALADAGLAPADLDLIVAASSGAQQTIPLYRSVHPAGPGRARGPERLFRCQCHLPQLCGGTADGGPPGDGRYLSLCPDCFQRAP
jgi:hypothetical protein